jgi:hypothetical protein
LLQGKALSTEDAVDVLTLKNNTDTVEDYATALHLLARAQVSCYSLLPCRHSHIADRTFQTLGSKLHSVRYGGVYISMMSESIFPTTISNPASHFLSAGTPSDKQRISPMLSLTPGSKVQHYTQRCEPSSPRIISPRVTNYLPRKLSLFLCS